MRLTRNMQYAVLLAALCLSAAAQACDSSAARADRPGEKMARDEYALEFGIEPGTVAVESGADERAAAATPAYVYRSARVAGLRGKRLPPTLFRDDTGS